MRKYLFFLCMYPLFNMYSQEIIENKFYKLSFRKESKILLFKSSHEEKASIDIYIRLLHRKNWNILSI